MQNTVKLFTMSHNAKKDGSLRFFLYIAHVQYTPMMASKPNLPVMVHLFKKHSWWNEIGNDWHQQPYTREKWTIPL